MKAFCICLFLLCASDLAFPQNERFKSLFIYNFTKNIEWPAEYRQGQFVITVLGSSSIYNELLQNVTGKHTGSQTILVTQAANIAGVGKCNILYIPSPQSYLLEAAAKQLSGTPTVIITEKNGMMRQGADINIVQHGGKLQFEIDPKQLETKNLTTAKTLLSLGITYQQGNMRKPSRLESVNDASIPK